MLALIAISFITTTLISECFAVSKDVEPSVHAFYYLWYGNPEIDGTYKHWNHEVLPHWKQSVNDQYKNIGTYFKPEEGHIHSPYYPLAGLFSSADTVNMKVQFDQIVQAGIDVLIVSWWGKFDKPYATDTQGVNTDMNLGKLFEYAESDQRVKIGIHMEPYPSRSVESIREDIVYIHETYGHYSCMYRVDNRPVLYVYDSYHITPIDWARLLTVGGDISIRNTYSIEQFDHSLLLSDVNPKVCSQTFCDNRIFNDVDVFVLGLWLDRQHGMDLARSGFDGIYSYFAAEGFSYGSSVRHWGSMCQFCAQQHMVCSLSVGPGYNDSLIRPWNHQNHKSRQDGEYYAFMWSSALKAKPNWISITSYNEWGEGTQIEPAKPVVTKDGRVYSDYGQGGPHLYIKATAAFSGKYKNKTNLITV